jgi:hypothetical protein
MIEMHPAGPVRTLASFLAKALDPPISRFDPTYKWIHPCAACSAAMIKSVAKISGNMNGSIRQPMLPHIHLLPLSMETEERNHGQNHDNQPDQIDDAVHAKPPLISIGNVVGI